MELLLKERRMTKMRGCIFVPVARRKEKDKDIKK